ncbi:Rv1733c family protein [Planobispora takensis]|uniref:Rv1733c family protein n=1 Tax=Planobispora takensis TaxID=1367882 RepID=UPI001944171D|nr:hypothetical protein [Planobispora takensis]
MTEAMIRCVRRYRLDGNELRRRSDRLETAALLVALGVIVLSVWPALILGRLAYADGLAGERTGPGVREPVAATLLQDAPAPGIMAAGQKASKPTVTVRWRTASGAQMTAEAKVRPGARAGTVTRIWVDGQGRVTAPPERRSASVIRAVAVGAAVMAGVVGVMTSCLLGLRGLLDRGRYAEWEASWIREFERGPHQGEPS